MSTKNNGESEFTHLVDIFKEYFENAALHAKKKEEVNDFSCVFQRFLLPFLKYLHSFD